ncbi:MAG TPA: LysR family transcriptional regulator [Rhodospirillales bacterium]
MDIGLARTFLAIADAGNFVKAAERLNITQSTVSARVKLLESLLGQALFVRSKSGAVLTPSGVQFRRFAEKLVQTWEHAKQEVGLADEFHALLTVGVEFTLWERLLVRWLPWVRAAIPDTAIRADVGSSSYLTRQLVDGLLDLSITYTPQYRTGVVIEKLMDEHLMLVSTDLKTKAPWEPGYIFVDWGPEFRNEHMATFPTQQSPVISVTYGPLALQHILANGGSAYLPHRIVARMLKDGRLYDIAKAPRFTRPVYVAYVGGEGDERFKTAIQGLRLVAAQEEADEKTVN